MHLSRKRPVALENILCDIIRELTPTFRAKLYAPIYVIVSEGVNVIGINSTSRYILFFRNYYSRTQAPTDYRRYSIITDDVLYARNILWAYIILFTK